MPLVNASHLPGEQMLSRAGGVTALLQRASCASVPRGATPPLGTAGLAPGQGPRGVQVRMLQAWGLLLQLLHRVLARFWQQ